MKQCKKCGETKALDDFPVARSCVDGRAGKCRACRAVEMRERRRQNAASAVAPPEKRCSKCEQVKPAAEYHRKRGELDGLAHWCKECHKKLPCQVNRDRTTEYEALVKKRAALYGSEYRTIGPPRLQRPQGREGHGVAIEVGWMKNLGSSWGFEGRVSRDGRTFVDTHHPGLEFRFP